MKDIELELEFDLFTQDELDSYLSEYISSQFVLNIILEAIRINLGNKLSKAVIRVYGNEGAIPYFHIISDIAKFETCIEIKPLYFKHGNKQGTLTNI